MAFIHEIRRFNKTAEKQVRQAEIHRYMRQRGATVSMSGLNQCVNGKFFKDRALTRQVKDGLRAFAQDRMRAGNINPATEADFMEVDMLKPVFVEPPTLKYFGMLHNPFETVPQTLFKNDTIEDVEYAVKACVTQKKFIALIGPVGSGKTSLVHDIEESLRDDENNYIIRPQVFAPGRIGETTLLEAMLRDMSRGAEIVWGNYERRARKLADMFRDYVPEGRNFILIIDNAHELNDKALKFLKRIYDLQVKMKSVMSIVLVGQKEFEDTLNRADLSEVTQRLMIIKMPEYKSCVKEYIEHRAGTDFVKNYIDEDTVRAIVELGGMFNPLTPLYINNLMSRAMRTAYKQKSPKISYQIVKLSAQG